MADIVLRDRNGKEVQYPGVNYLKVKTVDGDTQGFATYDPETLKAENIKNGVEIGDVVGKILIPDREEKTIDLDFSKGNSMTVLPSNNDELLFDESDVAFAPNPAAYNMCLAMDASGFAFEVGSEYQVHWDGTVHNCVAYDAAPMDALVGGTGSVAVGNGTFFNLQGNNEPFVFGTVLIGGSHMVILGSVLDTAEATHDVKIYKKIDGGNEKLLSKVDIVKPENLKPENIVKDVDIAGVIGTMDSGGGDSARIPFLFVTGKTTSGFSYTSSASYSKTVSISATVGLGSRPVFVFWGKQSNYSSSNSGSSFTFSASTSKISLITYTDDSTNNKTTFNASEKVLGLQKYYGYAGTLVVVFTTPGFYLRISADGTAMLYADETVTNCTSISPAIPIGVADFSDSNLTAFPNYAFNNCDSLREVKFPSTLAEIQSSAISNCSALEIVDCSKCTAVPTLASSSAFTTNTNLQIKVPAALYDEWIAATNWSSLASYIVPV